MQWGIPRAQPLQKGGSLRDQSNNYSAWWNHRHPHAGPGDPGRRGETMSLYKQLWLAIACLMAMTFGATLLITSMAARDYLEHHVLMANVERASAFARDLDALGNDTAALAASLEDSFRSGRYEEITLADATGEVQAQWLQSAQASPLQGWFRRLFAVDVPAGSAQLKAGSQVVSVRSDTGAANKTLWRTTVGLGVIFLLAAIGAGALGTVVLRRILRPLESVVGQAKAIGQRRFVTIHEPEAKELQPAVRSMNELSGRVKAMLEAETSRLEQWQSSAHKDSLTGLLNREQFVRELGSVLQADDYNTSGVISLVRVADLAMLNQVHGRDTLDQVLAGFGKVLSRLHAYNKGSLVARLNGADFVLLAPRELEAALVGKDLQKAMAEVLQERGLGDAVKLPAASTLYMPGDSPTDLLTNLDSALLNSELRCECELVTMGRDGIQMMPARQELKRWRSMLSLAFGERHFALGSFPVTTISGELLHYEAPARLNWQDKTLTAGQFLPWISRLDMDGDLDREIIGLALQRIAAEGESVGINLSSTALMDVEFLPWLSRELSCQPEAAALLWIEVAEAAAYRHLEEFKRLCARCKRYGTRVGLEHVGHQLSKFGNLHDAGVDYVKVDSAFVRDIDANPANRTLLTTLCTLVHSLGAQVIAEGVQEDEERRALAELGVDGVTGPQVTAATRPAPDDKPAPQWAGGNELASA